MLRTLLLIAFTLLIPRLLSAEDYSLHHFERIQLTDTYYSEGANFGDFNGDGVNDVVYGPLWFAGPDFKTSHEIYPPVPQNRDRYADNFFSWVYDFNQDGFGDVFVVGFPGTPAYVYENPGKSGHDKYWTKHEVFDWVSNESPHFTNLVGDEKPELVCTRDGFFGYASIDWDNPLGKWTFHPISEQVTAKRFGHGLGVGDINGDGLLDIIHSKGWYEQPAEKAGDSRWLEHQASFTGAYGGAEMYAYDVDGDGDNDVITSEAAHDFGLSWYEQKQDGDERSFEQHLIMGQHPAQNTYGVVFSELHSVNLFDVDGDGLKDIVTGKTYYSHHQQSPMWDAGAVVYWFKLSREGGKVNWIPHKADGESGIGRQLIIGNVNQDKHPDIVVGGMVGAHVLLHKVKSVSEEEWQKAQPKKYVGKPLPSVKGATSLRGEKAPIDEATGKVAGATEGESLQVTASKGSSSPQDMANFSGGKWSGNSQLFWRGGTLGDELKIPLKANADKANLEIVFTCARDYAIVQLSIDDAPIGPPIDLFDSNVTTTGVLKFADLQLRPAGSSLGIQILGANPRAQRSHFVGLDYFKLTPQ